MVGQPDVLTGLPGAAERVRVSRFDEAWHRLPSRSRCSAFWPRGIEQEFLPLCREFRLGTTVYYPFAGGLLTGKQKFEAPLPPRATRLP